MFKNFNRATTTTVVAIISVLMNYGLLFSSLLGLGKSSESNQTQIIQVVSGIMMLIIGFYFGSTNRDKDTKEK